MSENRTEYKYLIDRERLEGFRSEVWRYLEPDTTGSSDGCYPIVSQYYDTADRECYWEKERGLRSRRKIRVRLYGSEEARIPPTGFLEIKHKHEGLGAKRRLFLPLEEVIAIASGDDSVLRDRLGDLGRWDALIAAEILDLIDRRGFQPSIQLRYDRQALTTPDGVFRVTFDTHIRCRTKLRPLRPDCPDFDQLVVGPETAVLEVKSIGAVPYWFRKCAARFGLVSQSFSKFATAVRSHDPVLEGLRNFRQAEVA